MIIIKDFKTSIPRRATEKLTWAWEVVVQKYDGYEGEYYDVIDAHFFDPWKALQYGIEHHAGNCMVQAVTLHTNNLKGE